MATWLLRRLIQALFVVMAMTVIVFIGVNVIGNPIDILISPRGGTRPNGSAPSPPSASTSRCGSSTSPSSPACCAATSAGSFVFNEPALRVIVQRLPATMELAVAAVLISIVIGIPAGLYAGLKPNGWLARLLMAGSILGFSLPSFWVGLMLIMVFAVQLGWLPSTGRGTTAMLFGVQWSFLTWDGFRHLILPAFNLALFNVSLIMRLTRAGVREALPSDYVKFARAKGLTPMRVIGVHVMKNIMIPVVTVVGLELGTTSRLLGGDREHLRLARAWASSSSTASTCSTAR